MRLIITKEKNGFIILTEDKDRYVAISPNAIARVIEKIMKAEKSKQKWRTPIDITPEVSNAVNEPITIKKGTSIPVPIKHIKPKPKPAPGDGWICSQCEKYNGDNRSKCKKCDTVKPA